MEQSGRVRCLGGRGRGGGRTETGVVTEGEVARDRVGGVVGVGERVTERVGANMFVSFHPIPRRSPG